MARGHWSKTQKDSPGATILSENPVAGMSEAGGALATLSKFHQRWVLAFKWQYPNQRGNDTAFQAKLHTFRQAKKITIKVQIYSACVIMIIITSGPI